MCVPYPSIGPTVSIRNKYAPSRIVMGAASAPNCMVISALFCPIFLDIAFIKFEKEKSMKERHSGRWWSEVDRAFLLFDSHTFGGVSV